MSVTDTTVTLSWLPPESPNGNITCYQLQYQRIGERYHSKVEINSDILNYTVSGLIPKNEYHFRISASTEAGNGPSTAYIIQTTKCKCR